MKILSALLFALILLSCQGDKQSNTASSKRYEDLVQLFHDWRNFEKPPLSAGAPDYTTTTFKERWPAFETLRARLMALDTTAWPVHQQVDWFIVWAEMNGYDFNYHTLKPWERDPAFYKSLWMHRSDVPAHEGPTHHMTTEWWTYTFPLSDSARTALSQSLRAIAPLNEQAKQNLTGNAKELWIAGIRDIEEQEQDLENLLMQTDIQQDTLISNAMKEALSSTRTLIDWLRVEAKNKTGPSGIGKEAYTWYLQHVHLVPLTWEDEVMLLKTELAHAWSSLKLEEHRNRKLAPLQTVESPEAYQALAEASAKSLLSFLEEEEIVTVKDYFAPALAAQLGSYVPKEKRNFF